MELAIARPVLRAARPNFLSLTPMAHISVNLLNEHDDFRSGLDLLTVRTPFSGGSGSLPEHPEAAATTKVAGLASLIATAAIGLYFVYEKGVALLPLGLAGLLLVLAYTPLLTRRPLLCLFAPGLGFGPLMVVGTAYAVSGSYSWIAVAASLPPLLLVSELLLINQFPDVDADRQAGRKHFPIVWGRRRSAVLFGVMVVAAYAAIAIGVGSGILRPLVLLGLLPLPAGLFLARQVYIHADDLPGLVTYMGINIAMIHATLLLVAIGLMFG